MTGDRSWIRENLFGKPYGEGYFYNDYLERDLWVTG